MKKIIVTTTMALGIASFANAEEPTKHAQVGIASFATVISNDLQGVQDDEFAGLSLYATGAPTDNFAVRGLYGQQEHDDIEGLDVSAFEISVLAGTGLATEGFKAYGSFGFFDEEWEARGSTIDFNGAMLGGGIGYNWTPVGIDFWMNIRDASDYEDFGGFDVAAVSGGLGIAARF